MNLFLIYLFVFSKPIRKLDGLDTRYKEFNETSAAVINELFEKKKLVDNPHLILSLKPPPPKYNYDLFVKLRDEFDEFAQDK